MFVGGGIRGAVVGDGWVGDGWVGERKREKLTSHFLIIFVLRHVGDDGEEEEDDEDGEKDKDEAYDEEGDFDDVEEGRKR